MNTQKQVSIKKFQKFKRSPILPGMHTGSKKSSDILFFFPPPPRSQKKPVSETSESQNHMAGAFWRVFIPRANQASGDRWGVFLPRTEDGPAHPCCLPSGRPGTSTDSQLPSPSLRGPPPGATGQGVPWRVVHAVPPPPHTHTRHARAQEGNYFCLEYHSTFSFFLSFWRFFGGWMSVDNLLTPGLWMGHLSKVVGGSGSAESAHRQVSP